MNVDINGTFFVKVSRLNHDSSHQPIRALASNCQSSFVSILEQSEKKFDQSCFSSFISFLKRLTRPVIFLFEKCWHWIVWLFSGCSYALSEEEKHQKELDAQIDELILQSGDLFEKLSGASGELRLAYFERLGEHGILQFIHEFLKSPYKAVHFLKDQNIISLALLVNLWAHIDLPSETDRYWLQHLKTLLEIDSEEEPVRNSQRYNERGNEAFSYCIEKALGCLLECVDYIGNKVKMDEEDSALNSSKFKDIKFYLNKLAPCLFRLDAIKVLLKDKALQTALLRGYFKGNLESQDLDRINPESAEVIQKILRETPDFLLNLKNLFSNENNEFLKNIFQKMAIVLQVNAASFQPGNSEELFLSREDIANVINILRSEFLVPVLEELGRLMPSEEAPFFATIVAEFRYLFENDQALTQFMESLFQFIIPPTEESEFSSSTTMVNT